MTADTWIQLGASLFILVMIASSLLLQSRKNLGKTAQHAAIWGLILMATIALVGIFPQIRTSILPAQQQIRNGLIEIPMRPDGHYHAVLKLNGTPVLFTVDTGATDIVLAYKDAQRIGLNTADLAWVGTARTANGSVRLAPIVLESITLEEFEVRNARASVNEGEMDQSLLGMSFLSRFKKIEISSGKLLLHY